MINNLRAQCPPNFLKFEKRVQGINFYLLISRFNARHLCLIEEINCFFCDNFPYLSEHFIRQFPQAIHLKWGLFGRSSPYCDWTMRTTIALIWFLRDCFLYSCQRASHIHDGSASVCRGGSA